MQQPVIVHRYSAATGVKGTVLRIAFDVLVALQRFLLRAANAWQQHRAALLRYFRWLRAFAVTGVAGYVLWCLWRDVSMRQRRRLSSLPQSGGQQVRTVSGSLPMPTAALADSSETLKTPHDDGLQLPGAVVDEAKGLNTEPLDVQSAMAEKFHRQPVEEPEAHSPREAEPMAFTTADDTAAEDRHDDEFEKLWQAFRATSQSQSPGRSATAAPVH
jgi:hypothetical protein